MAAIPSQFFPYRRAFAIVLKVGERIVPIARHRDLFAGEPSAVFEPALADHGLEPGHAEISPEGEIIHDQLGDLPQTSLGLSSLLPGG